MEAVLRQPSRSLRSLAAMAVLAVLALIPTTGGARAAGALLSQGKAASASSVENAGTPASAAFDGDLVNSRWSSGNTDPQWIQVNLGQKATIDKVSLNWEGAYSTAFRIEVSDTG